MLVSVKWPKTALRWEKRISHGKCVKWEKIGSLFQLRLSSYEIEKNKRNKIQNFYTTFLNSSKTCFSLIWREVDLKDNVTVFGLQTGALSVAASRAKCEKLQDSWRPFNWKSEVRYRAVENGANRVNDKGEENDKGINMRRRKCTSKKVQILLLKVLWCRS